MKITLERIAIGILIILLAVSQINSCKQRETNKEIITAKDLANQKLDSIKNELGQTVTLQKAIITSNAEDIRRISDEKFALQKKYDKKVKEVEFYMSQNTVTRVDSVEVPYEDTVKIRQFKDSADFYKYAADSMITVPRTIKIDSAGFSFSGTVKKSSFSINNISFVDSQYVRVVQLKRNLWQSITFKKRQYQVQVLHTSPYIKVTGQNSIIFKPKSKINIFGTLVAVGTGIFISSKL